MQLQLVQLTKSKHDHIIITQGIKRSLELKQKQKQNCRFLLIYNMLITGCHLKLHQFEA
jgi:hypothetical protein